MNKLTYILLLFLISTFTLTASENSLNFLSAQDKEILYSDGELSRYFYDKELPSYLFDTKFENDLLNEISRLDITLGVESLYFLKYNNILKKENITNLLIFNTLLSVKTMKGIEYFSESRGKMRTLYTESYAVKSLSDNKALEDPVYQSIPDYLTRFLLQTDKTFGKNIYKAVYRYDGDTIWINMINKTKMKYKFIPIVGAEKMSVNLFIKIMDDGLLFYGVSTSETSSFLGLAKSKKESFYNRIKAMFTWFGDQLLS